MAQQIKVVGVGAGGHAKILVEILKQTGNYQLIGFTDVDPGRWGTELLGYPILGGDEELAKLYAKGVRTAFIGVGATSSAETRLRAKLFHQALELGFQIPTLIHSKALVSPNATIGVGSVVMAGAILNVGVRVGDNAVIYSGSIIEHDSVIDNHVYISPGAKLAGNVTVAEGAFVGIGASIIQGVHVGRWTTIGAGAVVLKDLPDNVVAVGVPARQVRVMNRVVY